MRTLGKRERIEAILVIPATVIFGPMIVIGLFGMAITFMFSRQALTPNSLAVMRVMACMAVAALGGLGSAWACILAGPEALKRHPVARWGAILGGFVALGLCAWMFAVIKLHPVNSGMLLLLGPVLVGLGYLPALLRR